MILSIIILIVSYLLGAIPTAYICARLFYGINIMEHGSGNVGTTNTFRVLGWRIGTLVFLIDISKGFIAAYLGFKVGGMTIAILASLIAVIAHTLSVFIHFKGGKGVATGAGTLIFLCPQACICAFVIWVLVALLSGYISLASVIAALSSIILVLIFSDNFAVCVFIIIAALYIVYKHTSNIKRLLNGTESKVDWFGKLKRK